MCTGYAQIYFSLKFWYLSVNILDRYRHGRGWAHTSRYTGQGFLAALMDWAPNSAHHLQLHSSGQLGGWQLTHTTSSLSHFFFNICEDIKCHFFSLTEMYPLCVPTVCSRTELSPTVCMWNEAMLGAHKKYIHVYIVCMRTACECQTLNLNDFW